jgi:hypothetical protein
MDLCRYPLIQIARELIEARLGFFPWPRQIKLIKYGTPQVLKLDLFLTLVSGLCIITRIVLHVRANHKY